MKEEILEPIDIAIKKAALRYANGEWSTKQNGKRLIHSEYYPIAKTGFEEGANWVINTMLDKEKVIETLKSMAIEDPIDGGLIIVCYDLEDTAMIDNTPNLERKRALIKASVIMKSISILTADVIKRQINLK